MEALYQKAVSGRSPPRKMGDRSFMLAANTRASGYCA